MATTDLKITYEEAETYLNKHEIRKLFEELTAILIYKRPEKPLQFLQKVIQLKIDQGPSAKPANIEAITSKKHSNPSSPVVSARSVRSPKEKPTTRASSSSSKKSSSGKKTSQVEKETRASEDKAATKAEPKPHSQFTITPVSNDELEEEDEDVDHSGDFEDELKGLISRVRPDSPEEEEKAVEEEIKTYKSRPNTVSEEVHQRRKPVDKMLEEVDAYDNEDDEDNFDNLKSEEIRRKGRTEEAIEEEEIVQRPSRMGARPSSAARTATPAQEEGPRGFRNRQKENMEFE